MIPRIDIALERIDPQASRNHDWLSDKLLRCASGHGSDLRRRGISRSWKRAAKAEVSHEWIGIPVAVQQVVVILYAAV